MRTRLSRAAIAAVLFGVLLIVGHIILGPVTGIMSRPAWISGLALGIIIAGVGNHFRIFGRR